MRQYTLSAMTLTFFPSLSRSCYTAAHAPKDRKLYNAVNRPFRPSRESTLQLDIYFLSSRIGRSQYQPGLLFHVLACFPITLR
jgi:hypothetical protein